jgi:hypothetical protein
MEEEQDDQPVGVEVKTPRMFPPHHCRILTTQMPGTVVTRGRDIMLR